MAFPPLVSSTPPPLDTLGDDDDDEFGDFTAGGIDGHSTASDSPVKHVTPILTPISSQTGSPKINGYSPSVRKQNDLKSNFLFESTLDSEILRVRKLEGITNDIEIETRYCEESDKDLESEDHLRYNNLPIFHDSGCAKPEIDNPITDRVPEIIRSINPTFDESQFVNNDNFSDNVSKIGRDSEEENEPKSLDLVLDDSRDLSEISQTVKHDFYDHRNTQHLRHYEESDAFDVNNIDVQENSRTSLPLNTNHIEEIVQSNEIDVDASTFQCNTMLKILTNEPMPDSTLELSKFVISDETDLESAKTLGTTETESQFDVDRYMWQQGDDGATISENSVIHSKTSDSTSITFETVKKVQKKSNVAANFVNGMGNYDTLSKNESNVTVTNNFHSFALEKVMEKSKITPNKDNQTLQPDKSIGNSIDTVSLNSSSHTHIERNFIANDIAEKEFNSSTVVNKELPNHDFNNVVSNCYQSLSFEPQFPSEKTIEPATVYECLQQNAMHSKSIDNVSFDNESRSIHLHNYGNTILTSEDELENASELNKTDNIGDDVAVQFDITSEKSRESKDCVDVVSDTRTATEVSRELHTDVTTANLDNDFDNFDDFADFTSAPVPTETNLKTESEDLKASSDDNFGDFEGFTSSSSIAQSSSELVRESIMRVENESAVNKIEDIITIMFPITSQPKFFEPKDECKISNNIWDEVKSIEETNALLYHWSNSTSNNLLLSALGIDSRNILFGPRWHHNIPRFAANLGFMPLEPVRASVDSQQSVTPNGKLHGSPISEEVPAAQFDWNSSGLVNPLGANSADHSTRHGAIVNTQHLSDPLDSPLKPSKSLQPAKLIEPLPGPSQVEWSRKSGTEFVGRRRQNPPEKSLKNNSQTSSKQFSMGISEVKLDFAQGGEPSKSQPARTERHKKSSINKSENLQQERMVLDRFGRPMAVREETVKVLKQLPDLSFLSARTLMFNPEQKQIVQDLGAMINRKMPG